MTIFAVTRNNMVDIAVAGTQNYAEAQVDESTKMDDLVDKLKDTVSNITSIQTQIGGTGGGSTNPEQPDKPNPPKPPVELPAEGTAVPTEGWSVEVAKGLVARDGLAAHLGEQVDYNPPAGGTWRIFYYDNEDQGNGKGYFGDPVGTVYLRRDKELIDLNIEDYDNYIPKDNYAIYDQINPKLVKKIGRYTSFKGTNRAAWLADSGNWTAYVDPGVARYAIASPSYEMFYESVSEVSPGTLGCYASVRGYACSITGTQQDSGYHSFPSGPNNIFDPGTTVEGSVIHGNIVWLASPAEDALALICASRGSA